MTACKQQRGFGVVEIMIALTISLVLMTGVFQFFISGRLAYSMTEGLSRMQESGRFAMDLLTKDIRMAGFIPCQTTTNLVNTLNGGTTSEWLDFFGDALLGFEGGVSTFPAAFPAVGTNPGDRVDNTDAIIILRGGSETYKVVSHNSNSAQFKLNQLHNLKNNDVLLICDNANAAIFQVTNVNSNNVTVVHNTGTGSPGNCSKFLGGNGSCSDTSNMIAHTYGDDSQVMQFQSVGYFIGISGSGDTRSLYEINLVNNGTLATEVLEMLEGVESMQILYGIDLNGDGVAQRYVSANNVTDWDNVINLRIGLLMHSVDNISPANDNKIYNVAGTLIGTDTTPAHAGDRRVRYVFSSTIKLRNRGVN